MSGAFDGKAEYNPKLNNLTEENGELRSALEETILNVRGLVEDAERVLRRAQGRLSSLRRDDD